MISAADALAAVRLANPDARFVPARPWVVALDHTGHYLRLTTLKDWGDGRGLEPLPSAICTWKQQKVQVAKRMPIWKGFAREDIAAAAYIQRAVNSHDKLVATLQRIAASGDYGECGELAEGALRELGLLSIEGGG